MPSDQFNRFFTVINLILTLIQRHDTDILNYRTIFSQNELEIIQNNLTSANLLQV